MPETGTSAVKDFIAGGVGGSCTVIVGQPLDTIKVEKGCTGGVIIVIYFFYSKGDSSSGKKKRNRKDCG